MTWSARCKPSSRVARSWTDTRDDLGVFDDLGLTGDRVVSPLPDGTTALAAQISTSDHLKMWRRARAFVDQIGRWPVVYWSPQAWDEVVSGKLFERITFEYADRGSNVVGDTSLRGLLTRADSLDLEAVLQSLEAVDWKREYIDDEVTGALEGCEERFGQMPPEPEVRRAGQESADPVLGIERYLLDWELQRGLVSTKEIQWLLTGRMGEPDPAPEEPAFLFLLPTTRTWEVYAHLEALWNHPSDRLIRAARGWHTNFGAECMTIYAGSSTHLFVPRPPTDVETAWALAREHYLLAWDTFVLQGHRVRDYARALMQASYWDLWSKP